MIIDFIKTGKSQAVVKVTLSNKGRGSYKHETFGDYITVERTINASGGGGYKIQNEQGKTIVFVKLNKVKFSLFYF